MSFKTIKWGWICEDIKASGFYKYYSHKKHRCRQDFWSFSIFGQPIEAQSKVICCFFSCNWWKLGHYRCCATGHIYLRSWHFDHPRGVLRVDANDRYHSFSWFCNHPRWNASQGRSGLVPHCWPGYRWSANNYRGKKQVWQNSERRGRLQIEDLSFHLFTEFTSGGILLQVIKDRRLGNGGLNC